MEHLFANFHAAQEPKRGGNSEYTYIGKANLTIGDAVRLNGISVFENEKNGQFSIDFPGFGEGGEYVIPKSPEAYAAMRDVIAKAAKSQEGYAYELGNNNPDIIVTGKQVNEPYADARFTIEIGDMVALYGVSTRIAGHEGNEFVAVDFPNIGEPYEVDGQKHYNKAFEGIVAKWPDKDVNEHTTDYGQHLNMMVRGKRKELMRSFNDMVKDAQEKGANQKMGHEQEREPAMYR